ncbi:hypothetical protein OUZ56_024652 [Daphnia magna]|uniref:Reverse transcriptase zinc-binding domain-containing protein n=1 Tax=Daphnia magna TaxID=35525 RepID=A0ABR0B161_9CRUS|nr:hypothetical protein OUZ56_024652 [Daphnia magna]
MFLFNQRLLPTRTRCHRLDPSKEATFPICHQHPETDKHMTFQCPERHIVWSWLDGTIRQMGSSKEDLIRGHFGPIVIHRNNKRGFYKKKEGSSPSSGVI